MIHYLVTEAHVVPMRSFLETWGKDLADRVRIITYESFLAGHDRVNAAAGSYIFTNLGIVAAMDAPARARIFDLHRRLLETRGPDRVLNDPAQSLRRYDLLRQMHQQGINRFNAHRAGVPAALMRLPVFVRHERRSLFNQPVLAHDDAQYAALLAGVKWLGGALHEFIAVEFCDTVDDNGLYRKYGAFVVGDRVVPRHVFVSRNWHVKAADLIDSGTTAEEIEYIKTNPHADWLRQCARIANISYGRIDYGLLDGRPQLWEINTNASIATTAQAISSDRRAILLEFVAQFGDALAALDRQA